MWARGQAIGRRCLLARAQAPALDQFDRRGGGVFGCVFGCISGECGRVRGKGWCCRGSRTRRAPTCLRLWGRALRAITGPLDFGGIDQICRRYVARRHGAHYGLRRHRRRQRAREPRNFSSTCRDLDTLPATHKRLSGGLDNTGQSLRACRKRLHSV